MLPRTLEPEVMDSPEEARDYDSMDHAEVNRRFVDDFIAFWSGEPISPILDVGTGTAQIPVEFCKRCDSIRVVGIDAAASMLAVAAQNVLGCVFATGACIELQQADAKALPFPGGLFGAVMSNSIVHHIPEPSAVIGEMVRVVQPGGLIFVRDLLRPADEATLDRLVNQYAGGANDHQRRMFADSLRAALTLAEVRHLVATVGMDPTAVRPTSDRHWTWSARKPVAA